MEQVKKIVLIVILILFVIEIGNCYETLETHEKLTFQTHATPWGEIESNPAYWNLAWQYRVYGPNGLFETVERINWQYHLTHTYIEGETDCNDMAIDVWNMLLNVGITSILVFGNLDLTWERFNQCNHTWLLIFIYYDGKLWAFPVEPTNGEVYFSEDFAWNPQLYQYYEGYPYVKPSDLRADLMWRW